MPTFAPTWRSTYTPTTREFTDDDLLNGYFLSDDNANLFMWEGAVIEVA